MASDSYLADSGELYCAKQANALVIDDPKDVSGLTSYVETYGSDASFCLANPFTPYWQGKVTEVVDELVNDWGVAGVYIDQIGKLIYLSISLGCVNASLAFD